MKSLEWVLLVAFSNKLVSTITSTLNSSAVHLDTHFPYHLCTSFTGLHSRSWFSNCVGKAQLVYAAFLCSACLANLPYPPSFFSLVLPFLLVGISSTCDLLLWFLHLPCRPTPTPCSSSPLWECELAWLQTGRLLFSLPVKPHWLVSCALVNCAKGNLHFKQCECSA